MQIKSTGTNQNEILRNILALYLPCRTSFELDPTYGHGNFYGKSGMTPPEFKFDIEPRSVDVAKGDCRDLPLGDHTIGSIIFDPPFMHAHGKESVMGQRYGSYPSQKALRAMYWSALKEFRRVLTYNGILVFKCQDIVESGKQVLTHCHVWDLATQAGFETLDLFVLLATKSPIKGWNHTIQRHSRKYHAYFMVFKNKTKG